MSDSIWVHKIRDKLTFLLL